MKSSHLRAALILTALGATLGPLLDGLHTYSGATWYADPQWLKSVWWCPPLFAFAGLSIGLPRVLIDQRLDGKVLPITGRALAWKMGLFFFGYALSGFLPAPWWVKLIILTVLFVAALFPLDTRGALLGAAGAAFGGWLVEWQLTSRGLFFHRDTQLWGVAGWLPALYALAAVAVGALGRFLVVGTR
ncbi:MAG: hypothetical protein IPJ65_34260 [Archangiaceae bacterium]|nr:hypothetical protein [Archangiaceae bacterium]